MMYDLPQSVEVLGAEYQIRSDYRAVLDICTALADTELNEQEKAAVALGIFYRDFDQLPPENGQEALKRCFWFINCGADEGTGQTGAKLMDWEQDFQYIVAPINRVMGSEIRAVPYMHWWTFVSAYYEIGDCLFAQIVRVREKLAKGKPLDKADREWYRRNRSLVDFKCPLTEQESELLDVWLGKN